jgi:hypothetical protein
MIQGEQDTLTKRTVQSGAIATYPCNATAASCTASSMKSEDKTARVSPEKVERRRTSNRLSARRWRNRKKRKFEELQEQIDALHNDHIELEREKSKLEKELARELSLAKADAALLTLKSRRDWQDQSRQIRCLQYNAYLHAKSDWTMGKLSGLPSTRGLPQLSGFSRIPSTFLTTFSGVYRGDQRNMKHDPFFMPARQPFTSVNSLAQSRGLSRQELSSILRDAMST